MHVVDSWGEGRRHPRLKKQETDRGCWQLKFRAAPPAGQQTRRRDERRSATWRETPVQERKPAG